MIGDTMAPIATLDQLQLLRPQLEGVVLMGGVFDILHVGHIDHLKAAKAAGKTLIVHVTGDRRVQEKKGRHKPYQPEAERAAIIAAVRYVDYVFTANTTHYNETVLTAINPDILFFNYEAFSPEIEQYLEKIGWPASKTVVSHEVKYDRTPTIVSKIRSASHED